VPEKPAPPNSPNSFCKPWGSITIPREIRAINKPISSFVWSNELNSCFLLL
jgi:hypothetical protein